MDKLFVLVPLTVGATLAALPLAVTNPRQESLAGAARWGGRILFLVVALALSFSRVAQGARIDAPGAPSLLLAVGPIAAVAAALLVAGLRRENVDPLARGEAMLMVVALPAIYAGLSLEQGRGAVIVANLALAFLGVGRIVRGRAGGQGAVLWEGILIVAALVVARAIEFVGLS